MIGGPLWDRVRPTFLPVMERAVRRELVVTRPAFRVEGSTVGDRIAAQGAAELVMDRFLAPRATTLLME